MGKLLLLFTIVPLVELYLLLTLGEHIGFWPTVAIVFTTGLLGAALAKREGLRVLRTYQATLMQGRMPEEGVLGAVLVLVGGVLLVTPGVLTDVVGVLLLVPPTRRFVATHVRRRIERSIQNGTVRVSTFGFGGVRRRPEGDRAAPTGTAEPSSGAWKRIDGDRKADHEADAEIVDE